MLLTNEKLDTKLAILEIWNRLSNKPLRVRFLNYGFLNQDKILSKALAWPRKSKIKWFISLVSRH